MQYAPGSVSAEIIRLFLEMVASMDKMHSEVLTRIHVSVVGEQPFAANSFEFVWTGGNVTISLCRIQYRRWFDQLCRDFRLLTDTFAHWWLHHTWKQDVSNGIVDRQSRVVGPRTWLFAEDEDGGYLSDE